MTCCHLGTNGIAPGVSTGQSVDSVHNLGFGLGRTWLGLGGIADVFGGVANMRGLEPGSSPTSGTAEPLVRGSC